MLYRNFVFDCHSYFSASSRAWFCFRSYSGQFGYFSAEIRKENTIPFSCFFFWIILIYGCTMLLFEYAPQSYYIRRIADTIPQFQHSTISFRGGSNIYGRFLYWQMAIDSFIRSPFIGEGFYSFSVYSYRLFHDSTCHAHNGYMHTVAELGLVGFFALWKPTGSHLK
ncbi:O-antigen ligase family protein [bacterium]|nr:O-antigen ligase family protein [bacterium]